MGTLYLVRHGQASFGADDYDQLSPLGWRQARRLGAYWRERLGSGLALDAVLTGTLRRHAQSYAAIAQALAGMPQPLVWPGLDEYDGDALIATGLVAGVSEARRAIAQGGVSLDGTRVADDAALVQGTLPGGVSVLRRGKKNLAAVTFTD